MKALLFAKQKLTQQAKEAGDAKAKERLFSARVQISNHIRTGARPGNTDGRFNGVRSWAS